MKKKNAVLFSNAFSSPGSPWLSLQSLFSALKALSLSPPHDKGSRGLETVVI